MVVLDTGWKTPGTVASYVYTNGDNIKVEDDAGATFTPEPPIYNNIPTLCNPAKNFSFEVPSNATIVGVEIRARVKFSSGNLYPFGYSGSSAKTYLYYNSARIGDGFTAGLINSSSYTSLSVGGESSLFGNTLTPEIVNSSEFGIQITSYYGSNSTADFDVIEMKVYYEEAPAYTTTIDETIDLIINNSYYGLGVESGLLDSFMNNSIKMIELQADNSLTPTSSENLKIDTFSDSTGYLNTVSSATATFDTNKYKRVTAIDETITLNISGVTGNKTACQLYINQIDNEEDCEITYDIISSSSEEELDIPINEYHVIEAFNPTTSKLNGGYIKIHLKNNAAVPTSGYPSIKTYALKLW